MAPGKIIPNDHVKLIQPLEIGTVTAIHVIDGQAVRHGDPLVDLDTKSIDADIAQLQSEESLVEQQQKRLHWLIDHYLDAQQSLPDWHDPVLSGQWLEYQDRLSTLAAQYRQRQAERDAAEQQAEKLSAILPIINQRSINEQTLVDKKLFPRQQHLETEQQRLTTLYDLKTQRSRVLELKHTLSALETERQYC